jgi:CelD/BcsL family acetyltransferase involved in cellulose biosynthesis
LTWEWLSTWWKHFGNGRKLLILTVEEENKILAIAPLMLSKYKLRRFGNISKVEFLGVPHSDYNNFIISGKEKDCLRNIIDYLKYEVCAWDLIELREVIESTPTLNLLRGISLDSSIKLRKKEYVCSICPIISLPESFDIFIKGLGRNLRQNLNKNLRELRQNFSVELKNYRDFGFSTDEGMKLFFKLHKMRWKERSVLEEGAFVKDFHLRVAKCFEENGWLGLYFLTLNDEPVSALYGFEYGQKLYYYLSGFDTKYSSYSVGNVLMRFLVEECIKRGFREFDMLRGAEAYKNQWTKTYRRNLEIRLVRTTPLSLFHEWITRTLCVA